MIPLKKEEADALYSTGIGNNCPYKYFNPEKKVWWVISGPNGNLPYTLCQDCYHSNRFGQKDESIKDEIVPLLLVNVPCNCDGRSIQEGFPINIGNGWLLGIYTSQPKITVINTDYSYINGRLSIDAPFDYDFCEFMLNFKASIPHSYNKIKLEIVDEGHTYQTLALGAGFDDGDQNIVFIGNPKNASFYRFTFNKSSDISSVSKKFTVKVYVYSNESDDADDDNDNSSKNNNNNGYNLLFEFDVYPRHVNEQCSFNKENIEEIYQPSTISI